MMGEMSQFLLVYGWNVTVFMGEMSHYIVYPFSVFKKLFGGKKWILSVCIY